MTEAARNDRGSESGPVTVMIRRRIKPGFGQAYEALEKEISADAAAYADYLGSTFLRPEGSSNRDFVTIVRFDSYESMIRWENSAAGKALIDRADAMSEMPADIRRSAGLSLWFTPRHPTSPSRWKMVLLLTASIFVLAEIMTPFLSPALSFLPQPLVLFISLGIQVALLTYFVLRGSPLYSQNGFMRSQSQRNKQVSASGGTRCLSGKSIVEMCDRAA